MALKNIAILGATGNIGNAIVKGILERKKEFNKITALTSSDPESKKFEEIKREGVKVERVDLNNDSSLIAALKGYDALIIALGGAVLDNQNKIVYAAIEAGVKRIYPSEFGFDYTLPSNQVPALMDKIISQKYIIQKAEEGKISYTFVVTGCFLDWTLVTGFFGYDLEKKTAEVVNEGKDEIVFTTTRDIGRFVASSLIFSEKSHNKFIRVQSFRSTGAEILSLLEKYYDSKFIVTHKTVEQLKEDGEEYKRKGDILNYIIKNILLVHYIGGTYEPLDNNLFPEVVKNLDTLENTVKDVVAGKYDYFKA